jgi:ribosome-associated translation inhibitor RaiA
MKERQSMIFSMTCKTVELREPAEAGASTHIAKLEKLLKSYAPDAVQLHCVMAKMPRKEEYSLTLNLSLPTGRLHCVGTGSHVRASLKMAFAELESQIKKHKDHLRHHDEWKRTRPGARALA